MFTHNRYPRSRSQQEKTDDIRVELTSTGYIIWDGGKKVSEGYDYFEESQEMADLAVASYRKSKAGN